MNRIIFHIDVNNAFLSWSALELLKSGCKIDIRAISSVVGGDESKRKGIVVARSIIAKKAGIKTGEPLYMARRKVDKLYVAHPNNQIYKEYSNIFYEMLSKYTPVIEKYSIDECFLDMTGMENLYGNLVNLAYKIKDEINNKLGFTVNVGIGNSKICAKMASDFEKPNKVHTLFENEIKQKMWPLNVDDLFMVGKKTSSKLHDMGIHTIKDLAQTDVDLLARRFKSSGITMHEYANGIDNSPVERPVPKNQGIGHSTTLPEDVSDLNTLKKVMYKLASMVGMRLRNEHKYTTVISVQLKNNEFFNYQHQKKLISPISSDKDIYEIACELLKAMWKGDPIRLIGLRVTSFTEKQYEQISLFSEVHNKEKNDKIQSALDDINRKYGSNTIKSASLFEKYE